MKHTLTFLGMLVLASSGLALAALAQDTPNDASNAAPQSEAAPVKPLASRYKRSRLTSDESQIKADKRLVRLTSGEDRTVDLDFDANVGANGVAVGNPKVVLTNLVKIGDKRQIVFKPLAHGETTVTIRDQDGSIRVIFTVRVDDSDLLRRKAEIVDLVRDVEGVDVRIVGSRIIVDGELLVPADYARLYQVVNEEPYKSMVINLTTLSSLAMQVLANRIKQDINTFAPKVETRVVNGIIFLEGSVDNVEKARRAFDLAKLYLPEIKPANPLSKDPTAQSLPGRPLVQNFILVDAPPAKKQEKLVRVTVHYVELAKDYNKFFGFKWEPGFTSGSDNVQIGNSANGQSGAPTFMATLGNLFPKLKSAQDAGFARVLKVGTIVVRSGKPASLDDSRDYPFTKIGANGNPIGDKVNVAFNVGVTPTILGQSDDIEMDLNLRQESVVGQVTTGQAPTVAKHSVTTKLYVKSNESAAVAGMNSSDVETGFNKGDPSSGAFADNTDALFTLKHTKNFNKVKSQFVIFVTPQVVENASDGTEDLKKNFRVRVK